MLGVTTRIITHQKCWDDSSTLNAASLQLRNCFEIGHTTHNYQIPYAYNLTHNTSIIAADIRSKAKYHEYVAQLFSAVSRNHQQPERQNRPARWGQGERWEQGSKAEVLTQLCPLANCLLSEDMVSSRQAITSCEDGVHLCGCASLAAHRSCDGAQAAGLSGCSTRVIILC